MAIFDPIVFNRLRLIVDDFTDAAHRLVQQLDSEIVEAPDGVKDDLQRYRDRIADLGFQLDLSDPDAGEVVGWGASKSTALV